jgi:hypothetical protein
MRTILLAIGLFVTTTSFTKLPNHYVYIDADPKEQYYHAANDCKEIKKGHKIEKVTLDEAVNKYHLKPCPECYKPKK